MGTAPERAGNGPAVHDRQVHLQQHEVGLLRPDLRQRLLAVMGQDDVEAMAAEPARHHVPKLFVVLDKQDLGHAALPPLLPLRRSM